MNTTPSSTPHLTSTTASDRPRSDQDQPRVDATRRVARRGRASVGPRWRRIDRQRVADRRHRRPVRCRAGRDHSRPDHRDVSRLDGRGPDRWRDPDRAACRHPCRRPPATDRSGRIRPRTRPEQAGGGPPGEDSARSSPPPRMRPTCAAGWARRHSTWMRRRTAPGRHSGAPPSPRGCPVSAGRNERCSSRRSMPRPVNRSCSTATAESTWWTPSPPAVPVAVPTGSGTADTSTAATGPTPRMPIWQPDTHGCWCCHPSAADHCTPLDWGMHLATQVDELRARGSRVETIFPDSDSEHMFGANAMDPSLRPPAARAGYDQGRALAEQLTGFWR